MNNVSKFSLIHLFSCMFTNHLTISVNNNLLFSFFFKFNSQLYSFTYSASYKLSCYMFMVHWYFITFKEISLIWFNRFIVLLCCPDSIDPMDEAETVITRSFSCSEIVLFFCLNSDYWWQSVDQTIASSTSSKITFCIQDGWLTISNISMHAF